MPTSIGKYMRTLNQDRERLIQAQWLQLKNEDLQDSRQLVVSKSRDRYQTPLVFDHSRVKLEGVGYINANYLLDHEYIATQAPIPSTMAHFWHMVWQEHVSLIVMLTEVEENGCIKAHRYWPTSACPTKRFQDLKFLNCNYKIELLEKSMVGEQTIMRTLQITSKNSNEKRTVIQLQHLEWPDHGCPTNMEDIAELLTIIHDLALPKPTLVHCSAGIGRTGTFITIRHELMRAIKIFQKMYGKFECPEHQRKVLREFLRNHEFSIGDTIRRLREGRKMMVHKEDQFRFCFRVFSRLMDDSDSCLVDYLLPMIGSGGQLQL